MAFSYCFPVLQTQWGRFASRGQIIIIYENVSTPICVIEIVIPVPPSMTRTCPLRFVYDDQDACLGGASVTKVLEYCGAGYQGPCE